MKPEQSPSSISRLRFASAASVPYRLVRLTVLITAAITTPDGGHRSLWHGFSPHAFERRDLYVRVNPCHENEITPVMAAWSRFQSHFDPAELRTGKTPRPCH